MNPRTPIVAILAALAVACAPNSPTASTTTTGTTGYLPHTATVRPAPDTTPDGDSTPRATVHVYGASIEAQVVSTPIEDADGRVWHAQSGWRTADWAAHIAATLDAGPATVVLGSVNVNDAIKDGGWDTTDEQTWRRLLDTAGPDDCVTTVLPWVAATAEIGFPGLLAELDEARTWLAVNVPAVSDGWRRAVETNPGLLADDGIHLAAFGPDIVPPVTVRYETLETAALECES